MSCACCQKKDNELEQAAREQKARNANLRKKHVSMDPAGSLNDLVTSLANGLNDQEVQVRLKKYGENKLSSPPGRTFFDKLWDQMKDPLVILLFISAIVSFGIAGSQKAHVEEFIPPIFIILIVMANAALGIQQEGKAEDAVAALETATVTITQAIRNGRKMDVDIKDIVPGDILCFEAGVVICADCRVLEANDLSAAEAALTGESVPIKKFTLSRASKQTRESTRTSLMATNAAIDIVRREGAQASGENKMRASHLTKTTTTRGDTIAAGHDADGEEENDAEASVLLFKGTTISTGFGKGVVLTTGMNTRMGDISNLLNSVEDADTPLQGRLKTLGKWLGLTSVTICSLVFFVGVGTKRGSNPDSDQPVWIQMLLISVSLIVAAVPEGLPVCVTIALAIGMSNMAQKHATCKKLRSVETLGSASIICSDKTGTLTKGEMTCKFFRTLRKEWPVSGSGYSPQDGKVEGKIDDNDDGLRLLAVAGLCNQATLERDPTKEPPNDWVAKGNLTDRALKTLFKKAGVEEKTAGEYIKENMFDSTRKMASTVYKFKSDKIFANAEVGLVKGAPNYLLEKVTSYSKDGKVVPMPQSVKDEIIAQVDHYSSQAYRVLAFAYTVSVADTSPEAVEENLVFLGLCAIIDPPRNEVITSIQRCYRGGIDVRMITGDYLLTAEAIAKQIGLLDPNGVGLSIDCKELRKLEEKGATEELAKLIMRTKVFARAKPEDKITVVTYLQAAGHICSMTGDGVNDAPALKKADIGVAMGLTGTDAARAAASMILEDDSFITIVSAVEEGRRIYSNIRKFVYFLLSTNIAEVLVICIASFMGVQSPLVPVQILWLNLMTDSLPALALCNEALEDRVMQEPPRPKGTGIIDYVMVTSIACHTVVLCLGELGTYFFALSYFTGVWDGRPAMDESGLFTVDPHCGTGKDLLCSKVEVSHQVRQAQTMVIYTIVFAELLRGYACRSLHASIFTLGFFSNSWMQVSVICSISLTLVVGHTPYVRSIFGMEILDGISWAWVIGFSVLPFALDEVLKLIYRQTGYGDTTKQSKETHGNGAKIVPLDSLQPGTPSR